MMNGILMMVGNVVVEKTMQKLDYNRFYPEHKREGYTRKLPLEVEQTI